MIRIDAGIMYRVDILNEDEELNFKYWIVDEFFNDDKTSPIIKKYMYDNRIHVLEKEDDLIQKIIKWAEFNYKRAFDQGLLAEAELIEEDEDISDLPMDCMYKKIMRCTNEPTKKVIQNEKHDYNKECLLPKLSTQLISDICKEKTISLIDDNYQYTPAIIEAGTGTGKTIRMCQFIMNEPNYTGVIFTHSNNAAFEIQETLRKMGYKKMDKILVFNSGAEDYRFYRDNPQLMSGFNWVITFNQRIYGGNIEYFLNNNEEVVSAILKNSNINRYKIVFIDECISKPLECQLNLKEMNEFENIINLAYYKETGYLGKERRFTDPNFWNLQFLKSLIKRIDDDYRDIYENVVNVVKDEVVRNYNVQTDVDRIRHYNSIGSRVHKVIEDMHNKYEEEKKELNEKNKNELVLRNNLTGINPLAIRDEMSVMIRKLFVGAIKQNNYLISLMNMFLKDSFIVDRFNINILRNRIKSLFLLMNSESYRYDPKSGEQVKYKPYLEKLNQLSDYYSEHCRTNEIQDIIFKYTIGFESLPKNFPIVIMDASASTNYRNTQLESNIYSLTDIYKMVGKEYTPVHDITEIRSAGFSLFNRRSQSFQIKHLLNELLESGEFEIKDKSIVLWFKYWKRGDFDPKKFIEQYAKYYHKDIQFIHYGSGDLLGTNKFIGYENLYVFSRYFVNVAKVIEHRQATGSRDYSTIDTSISEVEQAIGRVTRSRVNWTQEQIDAVPKIGLYFTEDYPIDIIEMIRKKLKIKYGNDEKTLKMMIDGMCTDVAGRGIRSNARDNMLKVIKAFPEILETRELKIRLINFARTIGMGKINNYDFESYIRYFDQIGIKLSR